MVVIPDVMGLGSLDLTWQSPDDALTPNCYCYFETKLILWCIIFMVQCVGAFQSFPTGLTLFAPYFRIVPLFVRTIVLAHNKQNSISFCIKLLEFCLS